MKENSKNIGIGILIVGAIGLVISMLIFLHPSIGDGKNQIHVRFANIDKIGVGTRVTFAGKPVGEVVAVHLVPDAMKPGYKDTDKDPIFIYELTLRFDSHVHVFDCDEIAVKTSGLMGERMIAITPRRPKGHDPKLLSHDDLTYASSTGSVEDVISNMTKKMETTMDDVMTLLEQNQADFHTTLKAIEATSIELEKLVKRTNELDIVGTSKELLVKTETHLDKIGTNLDNLLVKVSKGEGSLGKLLIDDDFYLKSLALLNKANTMMNDVNHYGVLFHLDKGWQRDRRKRIEELETLSTPKAFQNYLNQEMEKIQLSLARVNMALDKADNSLDEAMNGKKIQTKGEFIKSFAELLGNVQQLENTLKELNAIPIPEIDNLVEADDKKNAK